MAEMEQDGEISKKEHGKDEKVEEEFVDIQQDEVQAKAEDKSGGIVEKREIQTSLKEIAKSI